MAAGEQDAAFAGLLLATLNPAGQRDAERQLREAEERDPFGFGVLCARALASQGNQVLVRQLAGLCLKNTFATNRTGGLDMERRQRYFSFPAESKAVVREAVIVALQDPNREVWSSAAVVVAKLGAVDMQDGQWPDLMPMLQRWAESGNARVASLRVLGYLAEEWWSIMPAHHLQEQFGAEVGVMLQACARSMGDGNPADVRLGATEALFLVLGCARNVLENSESSGQVMQVILQNCQDAGGQQLAAASLLCLGRIACEFYDLVAPHLSSIASISWAAMKDGSEQVAVVGVEIWSGLANLELTVRTCDQGYTKQAAPALVPALLQVLGREEPGGDESALADAASACLGTVAQVVGDPCVDVVFQFLGAHFESQDPKLRHAAILAYGSIMEGSSEKVGPIVSQTFGAVVRSLDSDAFRRSGAWAVGRALEYHSDKVPEAGKLSLLTPCLTLMRSAEWSFDFGYVLRGVVASLKATPQTFPVISKQLLDEVPRATPDGREALLGALGTLARVADPTCAPCFRELLLQLLKLAESTQGAQQDGVGACLQALTECLGDQVADLAEPMMKLYMAVLKSGHESGRGLHEETLLAVMALVVILGPRFSGFVSTFWPILKAAVASSDAPSVSAAGLKILKSVSSSLGEQFLPYAEDAEGVLLQLLRDPHLATELRPSCVRGLGHLGQTMGARMPHIPQVMDALKALMEDAKGKGKGGKGKKGKGKDDDHDHHKGKDKGKDKDDKGKGGKKGKDKDKGKDSLTGALQRIPDEVLHMIDFADAVLEANACILMGLARTSAVGMAGQHAHGLAHFASHAVENPSAPDSVLCDAIRVLGCLAAQNHGLVAEVVWPETLHRLSECASRATDRQVWELFQQVSHALGAGQQWGGWSSSWW